MNSLRRKIQRALIGSILIVTLCAVAILLLNQINATGNRKIIQTMTMEYSIVSSADKLIQSYNKVVKNSVNTEAYLQYQAIKTELLNVVLKLKTQIVSQESKLVLVGVENTLNKVIAECDAGIDEAKNNNFLNISDHFAQANSGNVFVKENVQTLIQKELEYLSSIQERSNQRYVASLVVSLFVFLLILFFTAIYASTFSKQLISPIEDLTKTVEMVAEGNMEVKIDNKLEGQKDEVGTLTKSFVLMVNNIKDMVMKINNSKKELEANNENLEKMNKFLVARELRMVELKKRVSALEKSSGLT